MSQSDNLQKMLNQPSGWVASGYVTFKVNLTSGRVDGDFVIVQLGFIGNAELVQLMAYAKDNGWTGFSKDTFSAVDGLDLSRENDVSPICPNHNKPMKPSQHKDGWFCPQKEGGGFCNLEASRTSEGKIIIRGKNGTRR